MDLKAAITGPVARLIATAQNGLEVIRLGGLDTGVEPSPFEIVETTAMYTLRRYFPSEDTAAGPPVLMVHPMMLSADMWDVSREAGAVGILHAAGIDPWVIDFGSPDEVEGGMDRTLTDHIVALSAAVDTVHRLTGCDVHLAGYSQGGMFCYQSAAYRRCAHVASVMAFGSPVDNLFGMPDGPATTFISAATDFLADQVFSWFDVPGWVARVGFQLLDPVKSVKDRVDFVRQLHDREALLPREPQRRFLHNDGFIAWSGPAVSELLTEFIGHNRLMTGGFSVDGQMVTLADITCPVLAVVGEVDDLGQPPAVRAIQRAAPDADVYEVLLRAGHFGLVVGSKAAAITWPTVADWVLWQSGGGRRPANVSPMSEEGPPPPASELPLGSRLALGVVEASGLAVSAVRGAASAATFANNSMRTLALETLRTLPRLTRLSQINDHTRVSLGRFVAEQAQRAPDGEFVLFDDRAHTYAAVNGRIDAVVRGLIAAGLRQGAHVGVVMNNRPSALVAITALSRLGAVAVLMAPDADLARLVRLGAATAVITDPDHLDAVHRQLPSMSVLVLGGGRARELSVPAAGMVVDMERTDPDAVGLPSWYRPDPGLAREVAFVVFGLVDGDPVPAQITNYRWALSALGTASAAALDDSDTLYCLTPLHQAAGLLVSLGGAVAGGTRIALSADLQPDRFLAEVRRYGATVVSYTWAMLDRVLDDPQVTLRGTHPVRLFIGAGMPTGLWRRVLDAFAPANVVEFFATSGGHAVLANVTATKIGSKGRPLPGASDVELAAYDPNADEMLTGDGDLVRVADVDQPALLLARPRGPMDPNSPMLRSVFTAGDTWICTEQVFRRDADGDLWLLGHRRDLIRTGRGAAFPEAVTGAVESIPGVGLAVTYPVESAAGTLAVTAVTLREGKSLTPAELDAALGQLSVGRPPDIVHVVSDLPLGPTFRPEWSGLRAAGVPEVSAGCWYADAGTGRYKKLTAAARARLTGEKRRRG